LIGLATGPLTNLALALRTEPALPTLLRRLVIMGGAFSGERSGRAEFNIGVDPEAAAEVLDAWPAVAPQRLPIVCGLDLTRHIAVTPAILAGIAAAADNPVIRLLDDALRFYFEAHDARGHGYLAYLHDPLAAAIALEPELVTTRPAAVRVELTPGEARGCTVADWDAAVPNALIGVGVDPAAFFDRFAQRVATLARRLG
jgi:purine nucleosidase